MTVIIMSSNKPLQIVVLLTLCCALVFAACPNGKIVSGVNNNERDAIVNLHNEFRLKIAQGQVPGQPKGTNLKRMKWDNTLATKAQEIANTCDYGHVKVTGTQWAFVGQNLYLSWMNRQDNNGANWSAALYSWFDEYKLYKYPNGFHKDTGHYTQVVWADTDHVGCGYAYYKKDNYEKYYVCNYGPAGNFNNQAPYKTSGGNCPQLC